jgi:predicted dehydrogenase
MLRIAIVGCGRVADAHVKQIKRIQNCEIIGACDQEVLMAKQLCERFQIKQFFVDPAELISELQPDVVHITTPPESHFQIAKLCLQRGCHVYVEKPFTLNTAEAKHLIDIANDRKLKLTVGHDDQFSHAARKLRQLIRNGYVGDSIVHMESYYCYDFGDETYAKSLIGDKQHWVRNLPGGLLQNIISHGIARVAEFLTCDKPNVIAYGFISPFLKSIGEDEIADELRVIIDDNKGTTAFFTFSSQMRPLLHHFRVYGTNNGLMLDEDQQTVIKLRGKRYKSYAERFVPPLIFAKQYLRNWAHNLRLFLKRDFHVDSGKKYLIEAFYYSIINITSVPIPYREILLTSHIMDKIFEQI